MLGLVFRPSMAQMDSGKYRPFKTLVTFAQDRYFLLTYFGISLYCRSLLWLVIVVIKFIVLIKPHGLLKTVRFMSTSSY